MIWKSSFCRTAELPRKCLPDLRKVWVQLVVLPTGQAVPKAGGASSRPACLRLCYSCLAFPQSPFLLQPRKGFGLIHFQGSRVNYLCTCLGELGYKQNREFGMIILIWKKISIISMHSRCWRQNNLCPQFWRVLKVKSHLLLPELWEGCSSSSVMVRKTFAWRGSSWQSWCWVEIFKGCQMFGREWGTHLQVFFIQLL